MQLSTSQKSVFYSSLVLPFELPWSAGLTSQECSVTHAKTSRSISARESATPVEPDSCYPASSGGLNTSRSVLVLLISRLDVVLCASYSESHIFDRVKWQMSNKV